MAQELKSIVEDIKKHEGYEPKVYKCTEGYDTIGYGFAIKDLVLDKRDKTVLPGIKDNVLSDLNLKPDYLSMIKI